MAKRKTIRNRITFLIILCSFFISLLNLSSFIFATIQEEDNTTEDGDNLYQNIPYTFSRTFYNDSNLEQGYTTAYLQTQYIPNIDVGANDSITTLDHTEFQYPLNTSISMVNGNHYQNGTLDSLDDDYALFNSSYDIVVPTQPTDFTIYNGTSNFNGDLEYIDSNYTIFNSTGIPGHFPGTYTFTGDDDETVPLGWDDNSGDGCSATVYGVIGNHKKVLKIYDGSPTLKANILNIFSSAQEYGIIEFWVNSDDCTKQSQIILRESSVNIFILNIHTENFYAGATQITSALDNKWYHIKIEFECGLDTHYGLNSDTCFVYIDNIQYGAYSFDSVATNLDDLNLKSVSSDSGYSTYYDAFGYIWDPTYNVGNNKFSSLTEINFTVIPNLSSFSNLNNLNLIYSYRTNISQTVNFSIYNFDNSQYEFILTSVNLTFQDKCYYTINSSHYNATNDLVLNFEMANSSDYFQFQIDRLIIMKMATLNFTSYVYFDRINELLQLNITSFQRSNILQNVSFFVWDWTNNEWDLIGTTNYITTFQVSGYSSSTYSDYISNNKQVLVNYYGINHTSKFNFEVDKIQINYFNKTKLSIEKSFNLLGVWRYRFKLDEGLGTEYITSWTYFNVILPEPNFYAISESDLTTRWILQEASLTPAQDFHDDITGANWEMDGVSKANMTIKNLIIHDSFVSSSNPNNNYGSITFAEMYKGAVFEYTFWKSNILNYLIDGISSTTFYFNTKFVAQDLPQIIQIHSCDDFDESTITWNDKPDIVTELINAYDITALGWDSFTYYEYANTIRIITTEVGSVLQIYTSESSYKPYFVFEVPKFYMGEGYNYIQTNITEAIVLKSTDYGTHYTLNSGDYFEVNFQTNSDSQINLILLKDGVVNKTLTLSQSGNTNFNKHTTKISATEDLEFDQLKISSTFEDKDNVKIYDIKTYKYTVVGDSADFEVDPNGMNSVFLTPDTYNLRIFERFGIDTWDEKINVNITLTFEDYYYEYVPVESLQCRLTLRDDEGTYLEFIDYHIWINRSLEGYYNRFELLNDLFYVDIGTDIYFSIYDFFNNFIKNISKTANDPFIDLTLPVYSLKIKNEATELVSYTLESNDTTITKSGYIFPEEIIKFSIVIGNYSLDYINYEDNTLREYNFKLIRHRTITINTTYFQVYFGLFNFDGLGLSKDLFRFFINGLRKDFGFNTLKQDINNLKVLDYFNAILFNQNINLRQFTEYNIFIEVWTMILRNNYSFPAKFQIERNNIEIEQVIESQFSFSYRMLPKVEYKIRVYHLNGTLLEEREIELDENNKVVSFGFFKTEVPEYPEIIIPDYTLFAAFVVIIAIGIVIVVLLYSRGRIKAEKVPEDTRKHKKKKPGTYDYRL